jgi:hypothetical protein
MCCLFSHIETETCGKYSYVWVICGVIFGTIGAYGGERT